MTHKFVANDNKGNVNTFEVTSNGTKLGKVIGKEDFVVYLTIENEDMSGTMDKTAQEITDAVNNGQDIVFVFANGAEFTGYDLIVKPSMYTHASSHDDDLLCVGAIIHNFGDGFFYIYTYDNGPDDNHYYVYHFSN